MKILLVHNFYRYRGGEDSYFFSLKKLLEDKGHNVMTYTKDSRNIAEPSKLSVGLNLFTGNIIRKDFRAFLIKHKPNIVHANNLIPLITPYIYKEAKKLGIPVVQTIHNYRFICPGGYLFNDDGNPCIHGSNSFFIRKIVQSCYRGSLIDSTTLVFADIFYKIVKFYDHADLFLFPAKFILNTYKTYTELAPTKMKVLPYFVEKPNKTPEHKDKEYFLFVGLFSKKKGILELLEIFSVLPDINLVVIGDGPLKKTVTKYKKFGNIKIKGLLSKKEVYKYMHGALATIIPSRWYEIGPMVMYESMANGTPVIVPKIGVFKDVIEEGKTGVFYKFDDSGDLKNKILHFRKNRNKLKEMRIKDKYAYENKYSRDLHYSKLFSYYQYLLRKE